MEDKEIKNVEEKEDDNSSKKVIFSVILLSILVVSVIGISFATFIGGQSGTKDNSISTGTISMTYTENTNGIKIENAFPVSDVAGKVLSGENEFFDFTVSTKIVGSANVIYEIAAVKDSTSTLGNDDVRIYLEKQASGTYSEVLAPSKFVPNDKMSSVGAPVGSMVLAQETKSSNSIDNYRLRMWLSESSTIDATSKVFSIKVNVYGKTK